MSASHIEVTGRAADHLHSEYYWVDWPDGVREIAMNCSDARGRRVWRNTRKMESANVFAVVRKVDRPS